MWVKIRGWLCLSLLFFVAMTAQAVVVQKLYSTKIPVVSRAKKVRQLALANAFSRVLVKVSGNSAIASQTTIKTALAKPGAYVQTFFYVSPAKTHPLMLHVRFSAQAIYRLFRSAGLPIWGKSRPLTLIWMAIKNQSALHFAQNAVGDNAKTLLMADAKARGLPVMFPLLDLTDLQAVSATAAVAASSDLLAGSQRYRPDAILSIKINTSDEDVLSSQWVLIMNGKRQQWHLFGSSMALVMQQGVDEVSDAIAKTYAVSEQAPGGQTVMLQVIGLNSTKAYAKVEHYLSALTGVISANLAGIDGNMATFAVQTHATVQSLAREIALNSFLQKVAMTDTRLSTMQRLVYQMR
jgi:uncharacterized protein